MSHLSATLRKLRPGAPRFQAVGNSDRIELVGHNMYSYIYIYICIHIYNNSNNTININTYIYIYIIRRDMNTFR